MMCISKKLLKRFKSQVLSIRLTQAISHACRGREMSILENLQYLNVYFKGINIVVCTRYIVQN